MNNMNTNMTESAAALLIKLADMSKNENGEIRPTFICTEIMTKKENGVMTSLKKKGVLSTEVGKDEDGNKFLQVTFTADGLDVVRELTAADESNTEEPEAECEPCDEAEVVVEAPAEVEDEVPAEEEEEAPAVEVEEETPAKVEEAKHTPGRVNAGVQAMFDPLPEEGTTLTKLYKGSCYQATLNADGSCTLNDGTWFSSLTAAARFITGAKNISGRKFFGIPGKRVASK